MHNFSFSTELNDDCQTQVLNEYLGGQEENEFLSIEEIEMNLFQTTSGEGITFPASTSPSSLVQNSNSLEISSDSDIEIIKTIKKTTTLPVTSALTAMDQNSHKLNSSPGQLKTRQINWRSERSSSTFGPEEYKVWKSETLGVNELKTTRIKQRQKSGDSGYDTSSPRSNSRSPTLRPTPCTIHYCHECDKEYSTFQSLKTHKCKPGTPQHQRSHPYPTGVNSRQSASKQMDSSQNKYLEMNTSGGSIVHGLPIGLGGSIGHHGTSGGPIGPHGIFPQIVPRGVPMHPGWSYGLGGPIGPQGTFSQRVSGGPIGLKPPNLTRVHCPICKEIFTADDLKSHMLACQSHTQTTNALSGNATTIGK